MPEGNESENLEQVYESEKLKARERVGEIFDAAIKHGRSPIDEFLDQAQGFEHARELHGDEAIDEFVRQLPSVTQENREAFLDSVLALLDPILRRQVFDPELRARIAADRQRDSTEVIPTGLEDEPHLEMHIHGSRWDFSLPDGTRLQIGEPVMEISWASKGLGPRGVKDTIKAFRAMARYLDGRPDIKAVIAVSWMVAREGLMDKLGFHRLTEVEIPAEERKNP